VEGEGEVPPTRPGHDTQTAAPQLHEWMHTEHAACAWFLREDAYRPIAGPLAETYGNLK
jgi:hypothetical protein